MGYFCFLNSLGRMLAGAAAALAFLGGVVAGDYKIHSYQGSAQEGYQLFGFKSEDGTPVTWNTTLDLLTAGRRGKSFRKQITEAIKTATNSKYVFFECTALSKATLNDEFRFVVADGPESYDTDREPEHDFFGNFETARKGRKSEIKMPDRYFAAKRFLDWPKLHSTQSQMVAPMPQRKENEEIYMHLKRYLTYGKEQNINNLWRFVGKALKRWLKRYSPDTVFLNTDGRSVAWLHMRLDGEKPESGRRVAKYYKHCDLLNCF